MKLLKLIWDETLGMFVDDGALALQAVVLVASVSAGVKLMGLPPLTGGLLLLAGCLVVLAFSLARKARKS